MTEQKEKATPAIKNDNSIIKELLANMPAQEEVSVELPSRNKFYKLHSAGQPITLRAMTFEDEKSLVSNKSHNTDVLNTLLSKCVGNIDIGSLLLFDKLFY